MTAYAWTACHEISSTFDIAPNPHDSEEQAHTPVWRRCLPVPGKLFSGADLRDADQEIAAKRMPY